MECQKISSLLIF
jgi:mnmE_trmE_thdF: tRNA modification GTPase TrmE